MPSRTYSHIRKIDESQGGSGRRFIFAFETCNTDIEPVRDTMTFIDGKEGGIRESNGICNTLHINAWPLILLLPSGWILLPKYRKSGLCFTIELGRLHGTRPKSEPQG
ncbi:predicted protein [Histoplasma capsulatum H143]|uniref:Uncharacterized protein n=1 Tax=Ajellomyces capsulatus (strain H143) TaxID=544712 RepID=C6HFZ2_AJECH|nr:predicted protein [Histoplasma capsulatum H143]